MPCFAKCKTCTGQAENECYTCENTLFRKISQGKCVCKNGYIEIADVCEKCHYSCATCTGVTDTECNLCDEYLYRELKTNKCPCYEGMIEDN